MGRKSALTDKQWARLEQRFELAALYQESRTMVNNERAVTIMLKLMLAFGHLHRALSVPRITGHRFEFPLVCGRADLLLFHADGSVSIVEAKASGGQMAIAQGIGQLCMYASLLRNALGKAPTEIRLILCAPIPADRSIDLVRAADMAGVSFINLPSIQEFKQKIDAIR